MPRAEKARRKATCRWGKAMKVSFREGNQIAYGQDFMWYRGVPHDIIFTVETLIRGQARLIGPGHGGQPYGNGAIYVSASELRRKGRKHGR